MDNVYIHSYNLYGIVTAKFFYEDVLEKIKINGKIADENFPGWKNKPIYLITVYSPSSDTGTKYIALMDILTLTSELN